MHKWISVLEVLSLRLDLFFHRLLGLIIFFKNILSKVRFYCLIFVFILELHKLQVFLLFALLNLCKPLSQIKYLVFVVQIFGFKLMFKFFNLLVNMDFSIPLLFLDFLNFFLQLIDNFFIVISFYFKSLKLELKSKSLGFGLMGILDIIMILLEFLPKFSLLMCNFFLLSLVLLNSRLVDQFITLLLQHLSLSF